MNKNFYCVNCEIEFRIKHENDDDVFPVRFCPFCGNSLDPEEETYEVDEEDEE